MGINPNQIEDPDKIPHSFEHLNFQKEDKHIHWKQRRNLPQAVLLVWNNANKSTFITLYKTQLQMDQGLQQRPESLNLTEVIIANGFELIHMGKNFLKRTLRIKVLKPKKKNNKWNFMIRESVCSAKDNVIHTKQQPREWKKILIIHISNRGLVLEYIKNKKRVWRKEHNIIKMGYKSKHKFWSGETQMAQKLSKIVEYPIHHNIC